MMQNSDMIRMANQIAIFFKAYPRDEAITGIAEHIQNFWDPQMRRQLADYIRENGGKNTHGLDPLCLEAQNMLDKTL